MVEISRIKLGTQFCFCRRSEFTNETLSHFVSRGLSRPCGVTNHFCSRIVFSHGCILDHVLKSLFQRPSKSMHSSIHNKTTSSKCLHGQLSHSILRAFVQAKLFSKCLAMKSPSFDISSIKWETTRCFKVTSVFRIASKGWQCITLTLDCTLRMMSWNGFMKSKRFAFIGSPRWQFRCVDIKGSRSRSLCIGRSSQIVSSRRHGSMCCGCFHNLKGRPR
mmetsp:Transcript_10353/g.18836  ORF Transcript_10353/g.18836 Transcript_10353/m.18836 type:complete len:219 (+) Transcript_10353:410-1066(+)